MTRKHARDLPRFLEGLGVLLDTLAVTKARIVLLSPLCHKNVGAPLPDPEEHNKSLRLYRDALRKVADERGYFDTGSGLDYGA